MAGEKFGFNQSPEVYEDEEMLIFKHTVAFAWKLLYEDATRWRFQSEAWGFLVLGRLGRAARDHLGA